MLCRKCKKEIPDESMFCNHCGAKQLVEKTLRRYGNGHGTVYKDSNGKWIAEATVGWDEDGQKLVRKKKRKKGFETKKEALAYLPELKQQISQVDLEIKFKDLCKKWMDVHEKKVSKSTMDCYRSAYKYFSSIYYAEVANIKTEHMQKCIDECPHGKRTKQNMKALGTSLWDYAMQLDIVDRNYAKFLYIEKEEDAEKIMFTREQLDTMWKNVDKVPDIKYVLVLCYTGMRITEMTGALTENYFPEKGFFITGIKSKAGKKRAITISPKIRHFFDDFGKGKHLFTECSSDYFRRKVYYPALDAVGLDILDEHEEHIYTPHACRHTFATLMKDVDAPTTDKQKLIGHSKFEMTAHYTHTDIESLRQITDKL